MKKIYLLFIITMSSASMASAQVYIVPKLGLNITNANLEDEFPGQKSLPGFSTGLGVKMNLSDLVFFQPELLYSQKGYAAKKSGSSLDYDGIYRLNYLEIPLLFGLQFGSDVVKGYVNAGPSVGYLANGKIKGKWNLFGFSDDYDESLKFTNDKADAVGELQANRIEIGFNAGGGIIFTLADNLNLVIDLRYNAGLTDFSQESTSKNSVFAVSTGLQIKI